MELFDVLPDRFFSILSSPGKAVYAHLLFLIYDLHRQELYGIPRDVVMDAAAGYLETTSLPAEELGQDEAPIMSSRDRVRKQERSEYAGFVLATSPSGL